MSIAHHSRNHIKVACISNTLTSPPFNLGKKESPHKTPTKEQGEQGGNKGNITTNKPTSQQGTRIKETRDQETARNNTPGTHQEHRRNTAERTDSSAYGALSTPDSTVHTALLYTRRSCSCSCPYYIGSSHCIALHRSSDSSRLPSKSPPFGRVRFIRCPLPPLPCSLLLSLPPPSSSLPPFPTRPRYPHPLPPVAPSSSQLPQWDTLPTCESTN